MKRLISYMILALSVMQIAFAQQKPAVTIHTSIYDGYGDTNAFTLVVGGTQQGFIDVDCGYGPVEYELQTAVYNPSTQSVDGTIINCHVNQDGMVRIYCDDPARIEYFNGLGGFIRQIEFAYPEELTVLNLEHNELESLDLSGMTNLQALYLSDNAFNVEPFNITVDMPQLQILEIGVIENISPDFSFSHFPALVSVDAMSTHGLLNADTSGCPNLMRLSVDNTNISSVDVSKNPQLSILNVSDTRVTSLDLTKNPRMTQLYATHYSSMNSDYKIRSLSLNNNPEMIYLFLSGNALTSLDCSGMSKLREVVVSHNNLTSINLDGCESLYNVDLNDNCLDFNTLPVNPGSWSDYIGQQRPMPVARSIAVGQPLDLKARVIRDDATTYAEVFSISRENPIEATPVGSDAWTFADGVITFNKAVADSVYVEFSNTMFPEFGLQTARFKVKGTDEFGKPAMAFSFNPVYLGTGSRINFGVGIDGATEQQPKRVHVDFGDGELKAYDVTACNGKMTTISAIKPSYGAIKVYVEGDDVVTDVSVEDMYVSDVDVTRCDELRTLILRNLELYDIDLKWNRCLQKLVLTGNHFSRGLDLKGANGWYGKNVLGYLDLSSNELSAVELNDVFMLNHLDLSHNNIDFFNFKDAESLTYIDMSYNQMTDLVINYCCSLREGYFSHNKIESVRLPETNVLEKLSLDNNKLTFATLPEHGDLSDENYKYAPQADIPIPVKGPGHNLSDQYIEIDGKTTVYTWKTTSGETLVEGEDYNIDKGVTSFAQSTIGKDLYCEISHPAFPSFAGKDVLKTTVINSAGLPTNCLATFVTPVGGQSVRLSMTSAVPATAIYIDWTGKGELTQYILTNETYTVFDAVTTAGAEVKVYSYSNVSNLTVFSVTGASMESIDASGMKQVTSFSVNGAGLTLDKIVFPRVTGLREISLEGNNLTTFDFSPFTRLAACYLDNNKITSLDVSKAPTLEFLAAAYNGLEEVTFGGNSKLWNVTLTGNKLREIDFHGVPALYQVFLEDNLLSNIDLSYLSQLCVVCIGGNRFDFSNLPLCKPEWVLYTYGNQAEVKIEDGDIVDLSYLAERDGVNTVYRWFYDIPAYDYDNGFTGEELFVDDEYTVEGGVTTFHSDIDRVCCVMTNDVFPNMYLMTNLITAKNHDDSSIKEVVDGKSDLRIVVSGTDITVYGGSVATLVAADGSIVGTGCAADGSITLRAPGTGFYVVATDNGSAKVVVR